MGNEERTIAFDYVKSLLCINKRYFYIIVILSISFAATNLAWMYVFSMYDYVSTVTTTQTEVIQTSDGGSVNYTEKGDINNGETDSKND